MLYDRWLEIADQFGNEQALVHEASNRRWTFRDLLVESQRAAHPSNCMTSDGSGPDFVISVLRAWRSGTPLCPLERGQAHPPLQGLPRDVVHVKQTSASTGRPRLITFTATQLMADVDQIVATMGLRRDWPNLGVISMAHSYGFSSLVLPLLLHGVPLVVVESPLPESIRRAAGLGPDFTLAAVPALWRNWFDAGAIPRNVRLAISAGAPLPVSLEQALFARCGLKIHNFYGASECGGIAYDVSPDPRTEASCVGSPMRNVTVSVDGDGCLCVQSPSVGLTYWPDPHPSLQIGRFTTTDLARVEGGQIFLHGRQTDQINVAGRKVTPESVELALASHPSVRGCLVFGTPSSDPDRSEDIVACVATQSSIGVEELKQHLLTRLASWQIPKAWWFVPELPTNARGKLPRSEWRQRYLDRLK